MIFRELVIHDFGVYAGRKVFDLSVEKDRPIILVGALNGAGKTTFLEAIQLVLFGKQSQMAARHEGPYLEYLASRINRSANPQSGAAIELSFDSWIDGESHGIRLTRAWSHERGKLRERFEVRLNGQSNKTLSTNWSDAVEQYLPARIAPLFFFDGERIEGFADPEESARLLKTAVQGLLGLDIVERLQDDLVTLAEKKSSNSAADDGALSEAMQSYRRASEELLEGKNQLASAETRLARAKNDLTSARDRFEREGGDSYRRRETIRTAAVAARTRKSALIEQARDEAGGAAPLALVGPLLEAAMQQNEREQDAYLTGKVSALLEERDSWLVDQLGAGKASKATLAKVVTILQKDRESRSESGTPEILRLGPDGGAQLRTAFADGEESLRRLKNLQNDLEIVERDLETNESALGSIPTEEQIGEVLRVLEENERAAERAQRERDTIAEDVRRLRDARQAARKVLAEEWAQREREKAATDDNERVVRYAGRVRQIMAEFHKKVLEKDLEQVSQRISERFGELLRKSGLHASARIDPETFSLELLDDDERPLDLNHLSAGERQLFAVSMLWALSQTAGRQIPTVIDTPLGRLDSIHRDRFVRNYLPNAGPQTIVLSTDEEIDAPLLDGISHLVSRSYTLSAPNGRDGNSLVEGYFGEANDGR